MATLQDYLGITALRDAWPKWKANVVAVNNQVINHVAGSADKHSAQDITYTGDFVGKTEVKAALDQAKTEIDTIVVNASIDPEVAFARDSAVRSKVFGSLDARLEEDEQDLVSQMADYATARSYGAKGDYNPLTGIGTDDTLAIQSALDDTKVKRLFISENHKLTSKLEIKHPITIYSNGIGGLYQTTDNTECLFSDNISNITIQNLQCVGKGNDFVETYGRKADGIAFKGSLGTISNIKIEGCTMRNNTANAIKVENCTNFKISKNTVNGIGVLPNNNYQFGIVTYSSSGGQITQNDVTGTSHGIYIGSNDDNIIISGNNIHDIPGQHGMYITSANGLLVVDNTLTNIELQGIKIQFDTNNAKDGLSSLISRNVIKNSKSHGILLTQIGSEYRVNNLTISENIITDLDAAYGIDCIFGKNIKIINNVIDGGVKKLTIAGIFVKMSSNVAVEGNTIRNTYSYGIYVNIGDTTDLLKDVLVKGNRISNVASSSGAAIYSDGECTNLTLDSNITEDSVGLSQYSLYLVNPLTCTNAMIRNNRFNDKIIRFQPGFTALKEWDNNIYTSIQSYPSAVVRGRKVTVYHGTIANVPTSSTGYVAGDRYEYTNPVAGSFVGKILIGATWKDYGAIVA